MNIERKTIRRGRWEAYELFVDGVSLGIVRRTLVAGGDRMTGSTRYDGWRSDFGLVSASPDAIEQAMIRRTEKLKR